MLHNKIGKYMSLESALLEAGDYKLENWGHGVQNK